MSDLEELRAAVLAAESAYDLRPFMDDEGYRQCPCFEIEVPGFQAVGHCWRTTLTGRRGGCACDGVGLHVWGDAELGQRIAALLTANDWYGEWPLVLAG